MIISLEATLIYQYFEYMCNYVLNISEIYCEYISDYAIYPLYKHQENIIIGIKNILVEHLIYIGIDLDFKYRKENLNTLVVAM